MLSFVERCFFWHGVIRSVRDVDKLDDDKTTTWEEPTNIEISGIMIVVCRRLLCEMVTQKVARCVWCPIWYDRTAGECVM